MRDENPPPVPPEDPDERVRRTDPAGVRGGWGRPLLIIAIVGVVLVAIRVFVMLVAG